MRVEYHPETVTDLNRAVEYYDNQLGGLGSELRQEVYSAIDTLIENPLHYHPVKDEIRRKFLVKFPFSILFRVLSEDAVRILVIRHHRQHPSLGLERS